MKKITGNTFIKFVAGLLCAALLTGCAWFMFFGALLTMETRENIMENIMSLSLEYDTEAVYWYLDELMDRQDDPEAQWSSEYVQYMFDPELTNLRYRVIRDNEIILSNFDPETQPYLAQYTNWEEAYEATAEQQALIDWYERVYLRQYEDIDYGYTEDEEVAPTPTPAPMVAYDPDTGEVTRVDGDEEGILLTDEEYAKLREDRYHQYWIIGYLALQELPANSVSAVDTTDSTTITDDEPETVLGLAANDKYSALYNWLNGFALTPAKTQLQYGVTCGALALLLLIFLMMSAGHRTDSDEIVLRAVDRMPWDLWLVFVCCGVVLVACGIACGVEFVLYSVQMSVELLDLCVQFCIAVAVLTFGFVVWMLMSFAARVKVKGWWRNCLCGRILAICWQLFVKCVKWCRRVCKGFMGAIGSGIRKIPLMWKSVVIFGVIAVVEMVYCLAHVWSSWAVIGCLWAMIKFVLCMAVCLALKRLQQGARTIADGDLNHRVSTKYLYGDFKEHAQCLNRIGDGLSRSVDSQLRAERMKTELITNVSHDLKTPLTSIVNYVDLLKKEELEGTAAEYVEVLDRQSARLKKLTEDLVEASKASTGSLNVAVERVHLGELMEQARAEYAERLESSGLQVVMNLPKGAVDVWADGKYVWRILDNLLSNVCKYAMPNTRVYMDVRTEDEMAVLSVKNISRECLNVSADELMERFVRGDSSRNTEGSGLGLSIAQSLAQLMGGRVQLTVDGDLFKAEVTLPLAK